MLYIWLLDQNEQTGYDTFDSCVVISAYENTAREIHPLQYWGDTEPDPRNFKSDTWVDSPSKVKATLLGAANQEQKEGTVVCASFNAG